MISANELRTGNIVRGASRGGFEVVTGRMIAQIEDNKVNVLPIPLTPELLEACGALHYDSERVDWVFCPLSGYDIGIKKYVSENKYYLVGDRWQPEIEHLHQLQNIYFSLTNQELEIKDIKTVL